MKKKKIRILLVDDEVQFVDSLAERLGMRNLDCEAVYDGDQALDIVKKQEFDVVILDLRMPGMDGIEVLRQLKKKNPLIEVIILTGHGTDKDEELSKKLGAFDYLEKPAKIDVLVNRAQSAFRRRLDNLSVAATYAQAGDFDTAKQIMQEDEEEE